MANFIRNPWKNYGTCINYLWHISYAIKLWLNVVMEGLARVFILGWWTIRIYNELDYGTMGMDFVGSGGHGGDLITPGKMGPKRLKCWNWSIRGSFGFLSGCLSGFELSGDMLRGATAFPLSWKLCPFTWSATL